MTENAIAPATLLIVGTVWPEPNSSAAGSRMMQLIVFFQERHFKIIFCSAAADSMYAVNLQALGIEVKSIHLNCDSFDDFIKNINPSVVLFDRFISEEQYGWRVSDGCPNAMTILDTEDLHFVRLARQKAIKENRAVTNRDFFSDTAKREIASILRCDVSLIISKFEMELLQNTFQINPNVLYYLPFLLDEITADVRSKWKSFQERSNYIFIGNFWHEPNWDAVLTLKTKIWPLIKKLQPKAVVEIYGAYPSQKVFDLHNQNEGFIVKGRAENAIEVISKARVLLAPIRFGAGIKGKLVEAKYCGTPSVTTSIGAEAMSDNELWNGFITDDFDAFAAKAVALYMNQNIWEEAQTKGVSLYNNRYLKSDIVPKFEVIFMNILNKLEQHRENNFMGSILRHHSLQSTKYLSKWIAEKSRKLSPED